MTSFVDAHTARGLRRLRRRPVADGPAAGRTLVMVHGSMDRATSFTRVMSKLPDWAVVSYDRRGYAGSVATGPPLGFADQALDLVDVLGGEPAVLFGHSFGGDVVLAVAAEAPELVTAALVWEPPQPWLPWWPQNTASRGGGGDLDPADRAEWFMRRMIGDIVWERLPKATRDKRRAEGPTLAAEMASLGGVAVFDASRIRVPVLVGRGGRSQVHQRRSARELATALPNGELVEVAEAGHGAHLSHPAQVAALIRRAAAMGRSA